MVKIRVLPQLLSFCFNTLYIFCCYSSAVNNLQKTSPKTSLSGGAKVGMKRLGVDKEKVERQPKVEIKALNYMEKESGEEEVEE